MLTDAQVKALELRGLYYWRVDGKDLAIDLKNIESKQEDLEKLGIDLHIDDTYIELYPNRSLSLDIVDTMTAVPLVFEKDTLKRDTDSYYLKTRLTTSIKTLDLSDAYIRKEDLESIRVLSKYSNEVVLSNTLDKPDITSLGRLFMHSKFSEVDFTNFRGTYIKDITGMFLYSECKKVTWDYFDMHDVERAVDLFYGAEKLHQVNLSTFPVLEWRSNAHMYFLSGLGFPYAIFTLSIGELQEWCRKTHGCNAHFSTKTISYYIPTKKLPDDFDSIEFKRIGSYKLRDGSILVYDKDGINFDDMFQTFNEASPQEFVDFLSNAKPELLFPEEVDAKRYTSEFINLISEVYGKEIL